MTDLHPAPEQGYDFRRAYLISARPRHVQPSDFADISVGPQIPQINWINGPDNLVNGGDNLVFRSGTT